MQPDTTVRRVLIYRLGSLGDTVVVLPCFHLIARVFPNAERRLLSNFPVHAKAPASAAVLGGSGLVDGYMRYTVGTRNPLELLRLMWEIRRFGPDVLVYLMNPRARKAIERDMMFFRLAGVTRVVGVLPEQEMQLRFDKATGLYEKEASRMARLIAELGDAQPFDLANWDLVLSGAERAAARAALGALAERPLMVCGPGTKVPAKDWGRENWRALLAQIDAEHPGHGLALVGAQAEADLAEYAAQAMDGAEGEPVRTAHSARDGRGDGACAHFSGAGFRTHAPGCGSGRALRDCVLRGGASGHLVPAGEQAPDRLSSDQLLWLLPGEMQGGWPSVPVLDWRERDGRRGGPRNAGRGLREAGHADWVRPGFQTGLRSGIRAA